RSILFFDTARKQLLGPTPIVRAGGADIYHDGVRLRVRQPVAQHGRQKVAASTQAEIVEQELHVIEMAGIADRSEDEVAYARPNEVDQRVDATGGQERL